MSNITINPDLCKGCGQCVKDCAVGVLTIENGKCVIKEDKKKNCMQCGHCAAICKSGAIQLFGLENEKLPENPQTVEEIMKCRRSIRQWKGAVPNEEIKKLLQVTKYAPSACNYRMVKYAVINRPKLTQILTVLTTEALKLPTTPDMFKGVCMLQQKIDIIGRNAPHMIIAYRDDVENEDLATSLFAYADASIYLSSFELHAVQKGYGTFWCGFMAMLLSTKEAMAFIGLPGKKCIGAMGFGVPAVTYHNVAPRKDEEVCFIE